MSKLQIFLENALKEKNRQSSQHLGDRRTYVGASDIGGCPRKAVLTRILPVEHDAATLLKFARGHAAEDLIHGIFQAGGLTPLREMEIRHPEFPDLLCHIDFLFKAKSGRLHVVELKTTNGLPDTPYGSWVDQLHFQMGLLALAYPGADIGGSILAIDLNAGTWHEFNSYKPDEITFNLLVAKGRRIKACLDVGETPDVEPGLLCGFCPYRTDCPAFLEGAFVIPDEVQDLAKRHLEATELKKTAEKKVNKLKADILSFTGTCFKGKSNSLFINTSEVGPSETVDAYALKNRFPDVYHQVKKERAGFTRLDIKPI
jgi:hypothetical protein